MAKKSKKSNETSAAPSSMIEATRPVDPKLFTMCAMIYQSAYGMKMPVQNAESFEFTVNDQRCAFPNPSINRGFMAVRDWLTPEQRLSFPAIMTRIVDFCATLESARADPAYASFFQGFLQPDQVDGSYRVSEALVESFALANFLPGQLTLDPRDVMRFAAERQGANAETKTIRL